MIYFDNSATTVQKPPQVAQALAQALVQMGNPGRSFHDPSLQASRMVLGARQEIATLTQCQSPLSVAFTSGSTESLNLVCASVLGPDDHVITTELEHNSVLRPLYLAKCALSVLGMDDRGQLCLDQLPALLRPNTKAMVVTHGSNLLGTITPVTALREFCQAHGLLLILDVSQTLGAVPVTGSMAHVLCFTGHKGLMGPQGTGGIVCDGPVDFALVKTGGSGSSSFDPHQSLQFPDIFEAGTPNTHGLAGLRAGAMFLNQLGIDAVCRHEQALCQRLLSGLTQVKGIKLYGPDTMAPEGRLPVVAVNLEGHSADDVAFALWDRWAIATRAGSHCAPLVHKHFATEQQGMVRLSMGYYNTMQEVDTVLTALDTLTKEGL